MIKIYYQDDDIVICEKPYGVMSQAGNAENMPELLRTQLGAEIYPVHRLDTTTTGAMVFAKNARSAGLLSEQIANRNVKKHYLAICHGRLEKQGEMKDYLYHDKLKNKSFVVKSQRKGAKEAILEFYTRGSTFFKEKELSLVEIYLKTGRTHQIRVQLSSRGNVLYGDGKYGAKDNDKIALHSYKLTFNHPITGKGIEIVSLPRNGVWELFQNELQNIAK